MVVRHLAHQHRPLVRDGRRRRRPVGLRPDRRRHPLPQLLRRDARGQLRGRRSDHLAGHLRPAADHQRGPVLLHAVRRRSDDAGPPVQRPAARLAHRRQRRRRAGADRQRLPGDQPRSLPDEALRRLAAARRRPDEQGVRLGPHGPVRRRDRAGALRTTARSGRRRGRVASSSPATRTIRRAPSPSTGSTRRRRRGASSAGSRSIRSTPTTPTCPTRATTPTRRRRPATSST